MKKIVLAVISACFLGNAFAGQNTLSSSEKYTEQFGNKVKDRFQDVQDPRTLDINYISHSEWRKASKNNERRRVLEGENNFSGTGFLDAEKYSDADEAGKIYILASARASRAAIKVGLVSPEVNGTVAKQNYQQRLVALREGVRQAVIATNNEEVPIKGVLVADTGGKTIMFANNESSQVTHNSLETGMKPELTLTPQVIIAPGQSVPMTQTTKSFKAYIKQGGMMRALFQRADNRRLKKKVIVTSEIKVSY